MQLRRVSDHELCWIWARSRMCGGRGLWWSKSRVCSSRFLHTTSPLDLPSIPILAKKTSTKPTTKRFMCLIATKLVAVFLELMGIGHTFKCQDLTPTYLPIHITKPHSKPWLSLHSSELSSSTKSNSLPNQTTFDHPNATTSSSIDVV